MQEVKKIKLEDGIEYTLVDVIEDNGVTYYYLVNENKNYNFRIRKLVMEEQKEFLSGLETEKEFEKAMTIYKEKHKNDDR